MYAATSPSDRTTGNPTEPIPYRWSDGAAELSFAFVDGQTRLAHLYQSDPCRVLFPSQRANAPREAVIVTTSGGIVGGDRLRFDVDAGAGTVATVTTQAAEKIYRSTGPDSGIGISLTVRDGALLEWMPQETILFDGARIRRGTRIDLHGTACALAGEIVVFGRRARDEKFTRGLLQDSWRIRRDGRLIWADGLHLAGDIDRTIRNRHSFDGAAAMATLVYCSPDAPEHLATARDMTATGGVTCLGDVLIARFVHTDAAVLRAEVTAYWKQLRQAAAGLTASLPRVWDI